MALTLRTILALASAVLLASGCSSTPSKAATEVYKQGLKQAEDGNVEAAMATLEKGTKSYPSHVRMRFELARLQYESGEAFHLKERIAMRKAADQSSRGQRDEALGNRRRGTEQHAKALPFYDAATKNLTIVADEEDDDRRAAWAHFLLMRCMVFYENWGDAYSNIEQAVLLGRPTGTLLAQWREFQALIKEKVGGSDRD